MLSVARYNSHMPPTNSLERFMARVSPEPMSGCWLWTGPVSHNGYGTVSLGGRTYRAHRISYELHVNTIPEGLHIDHLCKVRCCVNPTHLDPVTQVENNHRSPTKCSPVCSRRCVTHGCQQPALHRAAGSNLCPRCRQAVRRPRAMLKHLCERCQEVFAPRDSAPKKHRCMRCRGEFDCTAPGCVALYDVLPTMVRDGVVVEHECKPRDSGKEG